MSNFFNDKGIKLPSIAAAFNRLNRPVEPSKPEPTLVSSVLIMPESLNGSTVPTSGGGHAGGAKEVSVQGFEAWKLKNQNGKPAPQAPGSQKGGPP